MLTPAFEIRQTEDFVSVIIRAPFANLTESEFYVEQCDFKFYAKPYFLRLTFPGPLVEDGREVVTFDADTASFTIQIPKVNAGEHFPDLDLQTKLLAPAGDSHAKQPLIEVLGDSNEESVEEEVEEDEEESFDWQIDQQPFKEDGISINGPKYGFANKRCGVLKRLTSELKEIIDLKDADSTSISERRLLRTADEDGQFSEDHYWSDLFECAEIKQFIQYKTKFAAEPIKIENSDIEFTDYEKEILRKLPRKEYLLDKTETRCALLGLVDILFAYLYDVRTTEGENTVESGWTISKLSSTLSWFETFLNPKEVAVACFRRSLCYPLYRNWLLAERVWADVVNISAGGRRLILKCLIDIRRLFIETGDMRYIFNDLYIEDYCTWTQQVSEKKLSSFADTLKTVTVAKDEVGFDLDNLELAGRLAETDADSDGDTLTGSSSESIDESDSSDGSDLTSTSEESDTDSSVSVTSGDNEPDCELLACGRGGESSKNESSMKSDSVDSDVRLTDNVKSDDEVQNGVDPLEQFVLLSVNDVSGSRVDEDSASNTDNCLDSQTLIV